MARTSKDLLPVDVRIAELLTDAARLSGISQREIATRAGMSQNRVGTILRASPPPATVGEVGAIAGVVGTTASAIIAQAEAYVIAQREAATAAETHSNITPIGSRNVGAEPEDQALPEAAWESEIDHDQDHDDYDA